MNNISIKIKLIGLVVTSLAFLSGILLIVSTIYNTQITRTEKLGQLDSIVVSKKQHLIDYFDTLSGLMISLGNNNTTSESLYNLSRFFKTIEGDSSEDIKLLLKKDLATIKSELISHYETNYLNNINFNLTNIETKKPTAAYLPKTINGIIAQYIYIAKNETKNGEKN